MTARTRSTVPGTSPVADRAPLEPHVETLLGNGPQAPDQRTTDTESQTPALTDSQTPVVPESVSGQEKGPKWRGLERKEARLHGDQILDLALLRREISAQRRNRSEIITDNTLIRIAVDLLLAHKDRLRGDTEDELRRSVLPRRRTPRAPTESVTPEVPE